LPPPARLNCAVIEGAQRDTTQDWIVPRGTVPTVAELEARIDEAVVIARVSEDGVREVGAMALDAAKQARRAAEMAESASAAAVEAAAKAGGPAGPVSDLEPPSREVVLDPLRRFNERADAIAARLEKLTA
jgi:hypothetical protein